MSYKFNTVWSVCIISQKKIISGLTPRELQAIVAAYDHSMLDDLMVWTPFFDDWKMVRHFEYLLTFKSLEIADEPPIYNWDESKLKSMDDPGLSKLVTRKLEDDLSASNIQDGLIRNITDLDIESINKQILPRKFTRLKREYPIEIELNGNIFKTLSTDISIGGMSIKDELPEWITGYFSVKIFQPILEQSLVHTGWVMDVDDQRRHRIAFLPFKKKDTEQQFEDWIKTAA
ncbi:MAG: PilZ domain-containing protein [Bdellovibrionaceae bacterium]|nr:PilZ domain-containing protein [Pseudobdellovibrionaceae bacterium]